MFELGGVTRDLAAEAFTIAGHKLPIKVKLVTRVDYDGH
jgi:large subunit ribosomal protein L16